MINRLEDEIWTSYIARLLELNGVEISEFESTTTSDESYATTENRVLTLNRLINLNNCSKKYVFRYDTFTKSCLSEIAFVNFLPVDSSNQFELEFLFNHDDTATFSNRFRLISDGVFSGYRDGRNYDSYEVVQGLIKHAKNPEKSRIIFEL